MGKSELSGQATEVPGEEESVQGEIRVAQQNAADGDIIQVELHDAADDVNGQY